MLNPLRVLRRLRSFLSARRLDEELDEELRFHIEMETGKLVSAGLDERTARETALRRFGGVSRHRDDSRDARGVRPLEDFIQDVRVGTRTILNQKSYSVVAILTLAIGIGATTALWAAVHRVLLEPYPFPHAGRIVTVQQYDARSPEEWEFSPANYIDLESRARSFDLIAAAEPWSVDWVGPEGPERFEAALVTEDAFPIQGLTPVLGRAFVSDEFRPGHDNVVVISENLWRNRFGADSTLVGRVLVLDSIPRVVVGVMPREALQPYGAEVWLPKIMRPDDLRSRSSAYWTVLARLAPGVTMSQADGEVRAIAAQLGTEYPPTNRNTGFRILTLRESISGGVRATLLVLFGAVAFLLCIAWVNVANLQLGEALRRRRELAIRTAIGAGQGRLVRQLLAESLLLSVIGAVAGLLIAYWGIGALRAAAPDDLWQLDDLRLGGSAVTFAAAIAVLSSIAVGAMPVIVCRRIKLADALAAAGRTGATTRTRRGANRVLVVSEVALALVLLIGAGLMLRSLYTLLQVDRGFRTDGILITTLQAWSYYPTPEKRAEFVRQAVERLGRVPGVERVGMTSSLPLEYPIGFTRPRVSVEGRPVPPGDELPAVHGAAVTGGYFEALGISLEAGRNIGPLDIAGSPPVALVNQAFVRRFLGSENPLGKRIIMGFMSAPIPREIVGVVGDVRHDGLHQEAAPSVFVPHAQAPTGAIHLVARTSMDPALLQRLVRSELARLNGVMPLSDVTTMDAVFSRSLRARRFQLELLAAFSVTALLLSAIGIYGVMSRATGERTHEIGVRMAVGAHGTDVRRMVLVSGGWLALAGLTVGSALAVVVTRYMAGMLFGVRPLDPVTYMAAAAVLLAVALAATWFPAWRASRVDPVVALRND